MEDTRQRKRLSGQIEFLSTSSKRLLLLRTPWSSTEAGLLQLRLSESPQRLESSPCLYDEASNGPAMELSLLRYLHFRVTGSKDPDHENLHLSADHQSCPSSQKQRAKVGKEALSHIIPWRLSKKSSHLRKPLSGCYLLMMHGKMCWMRRFLLPRILTSGYLPCRMLPR